MAWRVWTSVVNRVQRLVDLGVFALVEVDVDDQVTLAVPLLDLLLRRGELLGPARSLILRRGVEVGLVGLLVRGCALGRHAISAPW
jgi:hypothetical protein